MSLQQDMMPGRTAVQPNVDGFSVARRHMLEPLVHYLAESRNASKIAESRKATQREISQLPDILQQDLAFSDGTVIALDRS